MWTWNSSGANHSKIVRPEMAVRFSNGLRRSSCTSTAMSDKRSNQHKPCPPLDELAPHIEKYYRMRLTDTEMLEHLRDRHIDKTRHGLSLTSLKRMRKGLGLESTRQQAHTLDTAAAALLQVRSRYPKAGARDMITHAFREEHIKVSRRVVNEFFQEYEPEGIREHKAKRLKRRRFWAAGVNDIWAIDQHDSGNGSILWWTNKNPRLILHYYLEQASRIGGIPMVTQSDPGSENYGVANAHTILWHMLDPSLEGTRQHRWMRKHNNVKQEITWSQLRRWFTPGFEDLLEQGAQSGLYDPDNRLNALVFRWLFIPWLQAELDAWKDTHNTAPKRADKNKILPHGRPQLIFEAPHMYDSMDFKVGVTQDAIEDIRAYYAPSQDPVFHLVPPDFEPLVQQVYIRMGSPRIERDSIWEIYANMVTGVREVCNLTPPTALEDAVVGSMGPALELAPGLHELAHGDGEVMEDGFYYMGGRNDDPMLLPAGTSGTDDPSDAETCGHVSAGSGMVHAPFSDEESVTAEPIEW
ncbi:hypothetical protein JB92DRAFT_3139803 [Gautieria morchelliformis]|nr:hypothetical protein JB92DRAFT_3139803 [Gautieria morchelliformis]